MSGFSADKESGDLFESLIGRVGRSSLADRLNIQMNHTADVYGGNGFSKFHIENLDILNKILEFSFKITGLGKRAGRNSLDLRVEEHVVVLDNLPEAFQDFTILQLSDIHMDGFVDRGEALMTLISELDFQFCVITGDFRFSTYGDYDTCLDLVNKLCQNITCQYGIAGILGNHDFIEMVPGLERAGIKMLLNENFRLVKDDASLVIVGVDDSHFYGADDVDR